MTVAVRPFLVLCFLSVTVRAISHAQMDPDSSAHVRDALARGAYEEAERDARRLTAIVAEQNGRDSLELARAWDLLVEALIRNGQAAASSTSVLAEQVVKLKEQLVGRDDVETARSLHNLANVYVDRGYFQAALTLHERALAIRLRKFQPDDQAVADSLDQLAFALIQLERFTDARRALARAEAIREGGSESASLAFAQTLAVKAWLNRYAGDYGAAQAALNRALIIREHSWPDHPDRASLVELRGDLRWLAGEIEEARRVWADGLAIVERTLSPDHPMAAAFLRRLAGAANAVGKAAEAKRLLDRGLKVARKSLAPCHPEAMGLQESLASFLTYEGDYAAARRASRRSLRNYEDCLGPSHSRTTTIIHNQALLASEMGDLAEAERLHERAVRQWSAVLGPDHPYVARGLDALAEVAAARGQSLRAHTLYERALALRRSALGAIHPDVAWTLANLARTVSQSGQLALASRYVAEAIEIYKRSGASDQPDHYARVLSLRGELESRRKDYTAAQASLMEALTTRELIFGASHPLAAETRAAVASVNAAMGNYGVALDGALEAEQIGRDHLRFTVRYLPERQALAYAAKRPKGLDLALSIVSAGHLERTGSVFDAVIQSRGVILDELAARAQSTTRAEPEIAALNAAMVTARERFANLMVRSLEQGSSVSRSLLDEARQEKEDAERALAEESATARAELSHSSVGVEEVCRSLSARSALVSFVRYEGLLPGVVEQGKASASATTPSYIAFITRCDTFTIAVIPLGSAATLERLVMTWRREAAGRSLAAGASEAERRYRIAGERLRRRVWDPVVEQAQDVSRLFVVPDGALNLVNFAALPVNGNRYLVEESFIHYLSTERDLITSSDVTQGRGLLAVGGAIFDKLPPGSPVKTTAGAANRGTNAVQPSLATSCGPLRFSLLPGTKEEVLEIASMWPQGNPVEVAVLTDAAADEQTVKSAVVGRQVVHLATHGFVLGSRCGPQVAGTRAVGGLTKASRRMAPAAEENPLVLAGLALAGANRRRTTGTQSDDGILTAEEVAGLNLQGTQWAVLSACDTGLGEVRAGEGVFGLRRAFQIAGARTVVMSLWSVEDRATREWMRALYEARLRRRLNTIEAVTEASRTVLATRRASGQTTHPFYWAGFVAAGDWR